MDVAEEIDLIGLRIYDSDKRWRKMRMYIFVESICCIFVLPAPLHALHRTYSM